MPAQTTAVFGRRRRRDILIALVIAVVAGVLATTVYLTSDIRAVTLTEAPETALPKNAAAAPTALRGRWTQPTDGTFGAVASARGVVVTTDEHGVVGRDPATGTQRWVYSRSNRDLCAVYSSDVTAGTSNSPGPGVRGIIAIYRHGNRCQEVVTLDPRTGARVYQATMPGEVGGTLISGGPYAGWLGSDLLELWRYDLYRTYQYGNQPASPESNSGHTGCTFLDAAVTDEQFATVENCPQASSTLRLVMNWADPGTPDHGGTRWKSTPRADIDTGATAARILGITRDRVAVLVNAPVSALVVYDADGSVVSRTPMAAPAGAFDLTGPTPRTTLDDVQYALLGSTLTAVTIETETVKVTATPTTTAATTTDLLPTGSSAASVAPTVTDEDRDTPALAWQRDKVIGLPGAAGGNVLIPTATGVDVANRIEGTTVRSLVVSRPADPTRVDLQVIGSNLVELRGDQVAVYGMSR